ncbi:MAG: arginine--tRNA ligase [Gemmatimonadota bacterium]
MTDSEPALSAHDRIRKALATALREMGVEDPTVVLERPREPEHGDWASNAALVHASVLGRPPRALAEEICRSLDLRGAGVTEVEVAGPGFLNFRLSDGAMSSRLVEVLTGGDGYGRGATGSGQSVMVEFVSANPTGPLHLGHGRQAALGDAVSELLAWTGWDVHREYYYNDAGKQIELLSRSVWARYQQELGRDVPVPEGGYRGEYVAEIARSLRDELGDRYLDDDSDEALDAMRRFAVRVLRDEQDRDLTELGVHFDEYYLESALHEEGSVEQVIEDLRESGLVYEEGGAVWLRTTEFGDQKDRVMVKSDGSVTYFVPDVAYHREKWRRGFHHAINVQGADHHGTVARVRAGLRALGLPEGYPEYVLHQMVTVEKDGEEVKFSKRAGSYTTLRDLFEKVGVDVVRYFFQMRRPESHLVFDLDLALEQSEKNPVYKIQYAHARMWSIFARGGVDPKDLDVGEADLGLLTHERERELVKQLTEFPNLVEVAAEQRGPHLICDYLEQTSGQVNSWYHEGNPSRNPELSVLVDDPELRQARLVLARAVQLVLGNGLRILGVTQPRRMVRAEEGAVIPDSGARTAETGASARASGTVEESEGEGS